MSDIKDCEGKMTNILIYEVYFIRNTEPNFNAIINSFQSRCILLILRSYEI